MDSLIFLLQAVFVGFGVTSVINEGGEPWLLVPYILMAFMFYGLCGILGFPMFYGVIMQIPSLVVLNWEGTYD